MYSIYGGDGIDFLNTKIGSVTENESFIRLTRFSVSIF